MSHSLLNLNAPVLGVLEKRYKRFLADVRLSDGTLVTAHCTNTGSMKGVNLPGHRVLLSKAADPTRKLPYTWELIEYAPLQWVGVNTANPNRLIKQALIAGVLPEFKNLYPDLQPNEIKPEAKVDAKTRLDFLLRNQCYIEVKNVTLREDIAGKAVAAFPDSVSERATKHLRTLAALAKEGYRCFVVFVVQRNDCQVFQPAWQIDPVYAQTLLEVAPLVTPLAYCFEFKSQHPDFTNAMGDPNGSIEDGSIEYIRPLPVDLSPAVTGPVLKSKEKKK